MHVRAVQEYDNQMGARSGLYVGCWRISNISFHIVLMVAASIHMRSSIVTMQNNSICQHSSAFTT